MLKYSYLEIYPFRNNLYHRVLVNLYSILFIQLTKELLETFSIYALNQILQHCNKKASPASIQLRINAFLTFDIHNLNLNIHFNSIRIVTSLNV